MEIKAGDINTLKQELTTLRQQLEKARRENEFAKRIIESERQYEKAHHKLIEENASLKKDVEELKSLPAKLSEQTWIGIIEKVKESRDEFAIKFAEWVIDHSFGRIMDNGVKISSEIPFNEKLNQFKNETPGNTDKNLVP